VLQQSVDNKYNEAVLLERSNSNKANQSTNLINATANKSRAEQNLKTQQQARKIGAENLKQLEWENEEVPLNLSATIGKDSLKNNPGMHTEMNARAEAEGYYVNLDGGVVTVDEDGNEVPLLMSRQQQDAIHIWAGGIAEKYEDVDGQAEEALDQIKVAFTDLESQKGDVGRDGGMGNIAAAHIRAQQNKLMGQAKRVGALLTPSGRQKTLYDTADRLTARARVLDEFGTPRAKDAADGLRADADDKRAQAAEIFDDQQNIRTANAKLAKEKSPKGELTEAGMFEHIRKRYGVEGPMGKFIVGDKLKPKVATIEGYALRLYQATDKASGKRAESANMADEIIRRSETTYWNMIEKIEGKNKNNMYTKQELIDFINKVSPNYKGRATVGAVRRHLLNSRKSWYGKQLRSLPEADPLMPIYLPNRDALTQGLGS
jgi:hypothetical protein